MRTKDNSKQRAIIDAAVSIFAARGFWDTPTSLISKTAGVADGTLFNYFQTKDDLINEVYLEIKRELADTLLEGLPPDSSFKATLRHIWQRYVDWGVQHPEKFEVLQQIGCSYELSKTAKEEGMQPFVALQQMATLAIAKGKIRDYPVEYLAALLDGLTVATIRFVSQNSAGQEEYKRIGFNILWDGIKK